MKFIQVGIFGKTGYGKSYLTDLLIKSCHKDRIIILDPHNQLETGFLASSIEEFLLMIDQKSEFKIRCVFEEYDEYFDLMFYLWELKDYLLVIDEISVFSTQWNIDENLQNIITRGRLKNISLLWNTQRPALISRTLTSMSWAMIYFKLNDHRDLMYVPQQLKLNIMNLKEKEYICSDIEIIEKFFHLKLNSA